LTAYDPSFCEQRFDALEALLLASALLIEAVETSVDMVEATLEMIKAPLLAAPRASRRACLCLSKSYPA
jgi:hypothetical protein